MRTFASFSHRSGMRPAAPPIHPAVDRLTWLWLAIGAALLPFTSLVPSLWLAAWIAPVFLLRFARTQRARVGIPLIALVQAIALGINWYVGTAPNPFLAAIRRWRSGCWPRWPTCSIACSRRVCLVWRARWSSRWR